MKKTILTMAGMLAAVTFSFSQDWKPGDWPVLKEYDEKHLAQVALPLGGIGTGTVSLGGRGELRDWEIMNVPAKKFSTVTTGNDAPFFAIFMRPQGSDAKARLLQGPLYDHEYLHYEGRPVNHHGFPRFEKAVFSAAYPFGQVHLSDRSLPVKVKIKGFNPLIPADADASGLPIAVLAYEVTNTASVPVEVSVCGSLRNFIGKDGSRNATDWKGDIIPQGARRNRNTYREEGALRGIYFTSEGVDPGDAAWGTMALTTTSSGEVSHRTTSTPNSWNNSILNFWDDFSADGALSNPGPSADHDPMASLAVKKTIAPQATESFVFYLTWHFPNRKAWSSTPVGNYYTTRHADAWAAATAIVPQLPALESGTLTFVNALLESTYPDVIKEAALFNLATLRSQTVFRLPDGHLMGWEGVMDRFGSCAGSCTHVWNYETATPFLFGELARSMRDVEFNYATKDNGLMNFRASLPLDRAAEGNSAAADGQMGCVMKMYRDWQLSGDNEFLRSYWPQVKKVLSYAWTERGWDGNQDGVMEGSQHNTMDVNYFGPNPQMGFWYMGALQAAAHMADAMNDKAFARKCRTLFKQGSAWMDANLFNGEYYEHRITDPNTFEFLDMSAPGVRVPSFQLGQGCLVDQLAGQYMSHLCGLGYLARRENVRTTLQSIMKYNFVPDFSHHFNNMRSYVMGTESGLLMASWPKGRLEIPFPYFAEVMTGFEYCAATGMIYEGLREDALTCLRAIRSRFDGARRNPFSEPECGHHYARSMASWSTIPAWSGFRYSGVDRSMSFTSVPGRYFWSNGYAWGTCRIESDGTAELKVLKGTVAIDRMTVGDKRLKSKTKVVGEGCSARFK